MSRRSEYDEQGNLICPTCKKTPKICDTCKDMVCGCPNVQAVHGPGICSR